MLQRFATTASLVLIGLITTVSFADAVENPPVVIVHGAWGGAHHWKQVADALSQQHQFTVRRASLTGLGERSHLATRDVNLDTHIQDVVNLIEFDDLQSVVLIGHSYGGLVVSGVVDAIPERISHVIYLDAHVLENGESFFSHSPESKKRLVERAEESGDGWLIPVDWENPFRDVAHPLATLVQPIKLTNPAREKVPGTYWLFTDGRSAELDPRFRYFERSKKRGWNVKSFPWNHNPHRDRPAEVVAELIKIIRP